VLALCLLLLETNAWAAQYVYVASASNVLVVDTATISLVNVVDMGVASGANVTGVALNPAGTRLYVSDEHNHRVTVLDTSTLLPVAVVPVGGFPYQISVNSTGTRAYVLVDDVTNSIAAIWAIDTATNTPAAIIGLGPIFNGFTGFAFNSTETIIYAAAAGLVEAVDIATDALLWQQTAALSFETTNGVVASGSKLYVPFFQGTPNGGAVLVLDAATGTSLGHLSSIVGRNAGAVALNPTGTLAYVTEQEVVGADLQQYYYADDVVTIDLASNTRLGEVPVVNGSLSLVLDPAATRAYTTGSGFLTVVDLSSSTVVGSIPGAFGGPIPFGNPLVVGPTGVSGPPPNAPVPEIVWRHRDDTNYGWVLNPGVAAVIALPSLVGTNWLLAGTGDFNLDGIPDLVWYDTISNYAYAWLMDNSGAVVNVRALGGPGTGWRLEGVCDLYMLPGFISSLIWRNDQGQVFHLIPGYVFAQLGVADPSSFRFVGCGAVGGAVENNPRTSLYWSYEGPPGPRQYGSLDVWKVAGGVPPVIYSYPGNGGKLAVQIADFDGDGLADVLWADVVTGATSVWYMPANPNWGPIAQSTPDVPVGYQAVANGHYKRDYRTDVTWFNPDTRDAFEWLMMGRGNAPFVNNLGAPVGDWFIPPVPAGVNQRPPTAPTPNLLWRHHDDFNYLWQMTPDLTAVIGLQAVVGANWIVVGRGDLDGDGFPDIVWYETTTGGVYVWYMNDTAVTSVVGLGGAGPGWTVEGVCDLTGDGTSGLVWRQQQGAVYFWHYDAQGNFTNRALGSSDPAKYRFVGCGTFGGTAQVPSAPGIVWSYEGPGPQPFGSLGLWLVNASSVTPYSYSGNAGLLATRIGDFDGDGVADVLWVDQSTGTTSIWYMNADPTALPAVQSPPSVPAGFTAAASGYYNHDNRADVVWFNPSTGSAMQWLMTGRTSAPIVNDLGTYGSSWFLPRQ
jgi:YVTN family beta-propeller protein